MKKRLTVGAGLVACLGSGSVLLRGQTNEKEHDPVKLSPQMYQVRLDNAYVRVLEFRSEPGDKEPLHFHPPGVVYSLSDGTIRVTDAQGHAVEHQVKAGEIRSSGRENGILKGTPSAGAISRLRSRATA